MKSLIASVALVFAANSFAHTNAECITHVIASGTTKWAAWSTPSTVTTQEDGSIVFALSGFKANEYLLIPSDHPLRDVMYSQLITAKTKGWKVQPNIGPYIATWANANSCDELGYTVKRLRLQ